MKLNLRRAGVLALVTSLLVAACGSDEDTGASEGAAATGTAADATAAGTTGDGTSAAGAGGELNLARAALDQSLDPAIFYGGPANSIEFALYESLVRYRQGTPDEPGLRELEPWLAESWEVSEDATTYTFTIRDGVTFHDGTPLDAEAVRYSFQRSIDIDDAPAYMLASVASMEVLDPMTLAITLSQPEDGFLDYFASPYGPKVVSPTLVEANKGTDDGQTFLQTNDAGSGPYTLASIDESAGYVLEAYPDYWGEPAYYQTVNYKIIPDTTSQLLQFESGDLDLLSSGVGTTDLQRLSADDQYTIDYRPATTKGYLMMNPNKGVTANEDFRLAVAASIDRASLVTSVYGELADVSSGFYPPGSLPDGAAPDPDRFDPEAMPALLETKPEYADAPITLAHGASASDRQLAETVQIQLQAAGIDVTLHELQSGEAFDYVGKPLDAPEMYLGAGTVDTAAPASFPQTYLLTDAPVNWLGMSVPEADADLLAALPLADADERQALYESAAEKWLASGQIVTLFDPQSFMLYRSDKIGTYQYDLTNKYDARPETFRP